MAGVSKLTRKSSTDARIDTLHVSCKWVFGEYRGESGRRQLSPCTRWRPADFNVDRRLGRVIFKRAGGGVSPVNKVGFNFLRLICEIHGSLVPPSLLFVKKTRREVHFRQGSGLVRMRLGLKRFHSAEKKNSVKLLLSILNCVCHVSVIYRSTLIRWLFFCT